MRAIKLLGWTLVWVVALSCVAWATGALYYDFPLVALRLPASIAFVCLLVATTIFVRGTMLKLLSILSGFALVVFWWLTLRPSNDRHWQPDVAQTAWAEIDGDVVTLHNVRNCDYRTETDYVPRWETRTLRLSQITGLDLVINYWGSPYMAHPIASFQLTDAPPICFSIETRKEIGENYSTIGGLYRQYELIYVCADERDVIRVRTNYRDSEDVYLYHIVASSVQARKRFLGYVKTLNALHTSARWYNAVTTNCTTSIRAQHPTNERTPWDWRILVNGKADELLYERGLIAHDGLRFPELKERSRINQRARAADQDPDFSTRVREGLPGFGR
ncbi:DUF4105 domain-containing protein [Cellulosimicrobium sp. KWT-B]|uniref:Lnb N-terminal periplasmic domain-containing protein n=1 Tax=Cellulosimicrobium sp. KWT-B TaxID=1981152 RepID=UPI0018E99EF1|nr:DUF4105 domain-containing protein [Cellulosimicrobium sp. KWT-B]